MLRSVWTSRNGLPSMDTNQGALHKLVAEEIVKAVVSRPKLEDGKAIDESAVHSYDKAFCACSCVQYIVCMLAGGKNQTVLLHLSI